MGPSPPIPGSVQPPRMYGMPPQLPTQSMTMPPAMGPTGAPAAAPSKIDPQQIPRPVPNSAVILYDTRDGNQANTPPVFFLIIKFKKSAILVVLLEI